MKPLKHVRYALPWLIFLAALVLVSCSPKATPVSAEPPRATQVDVSGGSFFRVDPQTLNTMLKSKDFTLINVHIPFEGDLPKTDLSIPYDQIDKHLDKLPADKNAKLMLYCRSGRMSTIAAKTLVSLGYTNVWELSGGMSAWEQAGFSLMNQ